QLDARSVQGAQLNGTHGSRWPARRPKLAEPGQPAVLGQVAANRPAAPRVSDHLGREPQRTLHASRSSLGSEAINGAARRRSEAAHARRRKTSEHGAHHVARAAPAARAGSEDDGAAVRVHRRRTDQGGHGAPLLRPGRGARPGRTQLVSVSLPHDSTPWGPRNGAPWRRRWPDANDYSFRILSLSLLAEERMRAPTPCFPFSTSASALTSSPYGRCVESSDLLFSCMIFIV
ncbi:hypothetical protein PVAP13_3NG029990, partial [Panicum virgatum]